MRSRKRAHTFPCHLPRKRAHVKARFRLTVDELVEIGNEAVDKRREDGEVVGGL